MDEWSPQDTTTHQDHVIAHVIDANCLGYFVFDEALYVLLDIGFVWTIFVDGEMSLLPHPVAIGELEVEPDVKTEIRADIEQLLGNTPAQLELRRFITLPQAGPIKEVGFFAEGERRRLVVAEEDANVVIETSLATAEIKVY